MVTKVKIKLRKEQWMHLISERQDSGLSVREWCTQNNLSENSYYYWLRKIRSTALEEYLPEKESESTSPVVFAPLQISGEQNQSNVSIIIHMGDTDIVVRDGVSPKTLETVVLTLKKLC